ncbi:unnamed protein product [Clavelina lepadiformis]|uniref:TIR domain-containing protein n=1 Tax=Clavelina lepadiformis TaxID=159417 RepID=A0ABP0G688_CLALP
MSKPEEQRLTEDKPQLVQPDNNEESSSGESDEQPGTSRAVAMQAGMPHGPADAGNQVLQTMESAEASQSALSRIDPGLIELASRVAESRAGPVMIINAPQFNLRDERHYQDNREYSQMDIRDSKNVTTTRVKVKQTNPLDSAKRFKLSTEHQESANNPFDPPQLNTQTQDPSDVTHPKQAIEANPHVEPHTDISEVTNQSNALNTEIPSTTSGNVSKQPTICRAERNTSGVLYQTGLTQPKLPISASTSQTEVPSTSPSVASLPTTSSAETNNPQATNSPCGLGANQHQDNNKSNQHIMISYNWNDSKDLAHKISDELSATGYKVWIDKNEMRGDIYDKMYEAVDNAYLVLMFLSENYKLSENCQREGKLAADKRKRIIPIITQDNYKMEGWTALLVSGKLYYDFSKESFEGNFDKLIQEIDHPSEQQQFTKGLETNKAEQTGLTQPKQPISASTSQTATPSTIPSVANPPTTSSAENRKDTERRIKEQEAIEKVRQEQKKHRKADLRPQAGINVPLQNIPVVYPNLAEMTFYQGGAVPKQETYVPSTDDLKGISHERSIDFDNLVRSDKRYTGVIGNPGAGKSTLSKRLAKTEEYTTFHINFMDLPDDDKLTLPEMLININYPNLDEETWKNAFEWVKNNQSQCLLVFDGLDQADFTFKKKFAKRTYDTKQSVQNIIAGLFNKNYLPGVKIITTSRPHSMLNLPHSLQPNRTIFIRDLSYDNMKSLFYAYTGTRAKSLWFQLSQNAPVVFSLCYNPLLLQLVIAASLNPSKDVGEITTTTRVFATVLEGLRRSDNTRHSDITALILQISRLAYNATKKSTVVITPTEMEEEGLSTDDVQDIIVALHAYSGLSQRVFDGDQKYFFSHQMFQECFTAWYFISQMSLAEFQIFVTNEAFADEKWSVIQRFICGLLIDMLRDCHGRGPVSSTNMQTRSTFSMKGLSPSDVAEKRRIWIKALKSQLVRFEKMQFTDWSLDNSRYISLLCELNESSDMELFNMTSQRFPTEMSLYGLKLSSSEAAIFCDVLRKQQKELKKLDLMNCFSPGDVERLISAISEMPGKVKVLNIGGNIIKDIPGPEFFAKIEEDLFISGCYEDGRFSANSSERQKIQLVLDQLHGSRLEVYVGRGVILTPRNHC